MDIHGENAFKTKSYSIGAYYVEKLPAPLIEMTEEELFQQKGIGASLGSKIIELLKTGTLQVLEDYLKKTPKGILELVQIKGLGPKKIAVLWKELGIESPGELEYACNENRLVTLKGFGAKTQQAVLDQLKFYQESLGRLLWAEAQPLAEDCIAGFIQQFPENKFSITGDLRRQMETVDAIEIITDTDKERFCALLSVDALVQIQEKQHDILEVKNMGFIPRLIVYFTSKEDYAQALFRTTGPKHFIESFTGIVITEGLTDLSDEEDIFERHGLPFIPPALRDQGISVVPPKNLIQPDDIRGIIHSHSTWSDGRNTIEEMARAAIECNFEYLVISDHSQAAFYAGGLKPEEIIRQHDEIDKLNTELAPFKIFKGIEADILNDGRLDYDEEILSRFDLVIASIHSQLKMPEDKAMNRVLKAIENPFTSILGHPTGRLLLSREGYPIDHRVILESCRQHQVVVEINAHPKRLDLDWRWIPSALERNVLLSINPDAHHADSFRDTYYGVMTAQKGGLTPQGNLSSFSLEEFQIFLTQQRRKRSGGK